MKPKREYPSEFRCYIHKFFTDDVDDWKLHCQGYHPSLDGCSILPVLIRESGEEVYE